MQDARTDCRAGSRCDFSDGNSGSVPVSFLKMKSSGLNRIAARASFITVIRRGVVSPLGAGMCLVKT